MGNHEFGSQGQSQGEFGLIGMGKGDFCVKVTVYDEELWRLVQVFEGILEALQFPGMRMFAAGLSPLCRLVTSARRLELEGCWVVLSTWAFGMCKDLSQASMLVIVEQALAFVAFHIVC